MTSRSGKGTLGCLFSIFVIVALGYFGAKIGEAFVRAYRFEDAMKAEVQRSHEKSNPEIKERLRAFADSLGIPEDADIGVARSGGHIAIWSDYSEPLELPFHIQYLPFHPHAEGRIPVEAAAPGQR